MMCILRCTEEGISSFAMIHDDFGTHACDAEKMQQIIAETFVDLHSNNDVLAVFKQAHEERHDIVLPALPERGDLNIHDVLNSKYFFG